MSEPDQPGADAATACATPPSHTAAAVHTAPIRAPTPCAPALPRIRAAAERPSNGLGIASLVTAIIALLSVVGGIVLGVVAVILGFLGWGRAKRGEANNGGIAVAGIVLRRPGHHRGHRVIGLLIWGFGEVGGTDYIDCLSAGRL